MYKLEVKTHIDNNAYVSKDFGVIEAHWRMGEKHELIDDSTLFYCFVSIAHNSHTFDFYIVPSSVVAKFIRESHTFWLEGNNERKDSTMRSFMLGKRGESYKIDMPVIEDYKDRWDLLR